jgi:hypothetical protein
VVTYLISNGESNAENVHLPMKGLIMELDSIHAETMFRVIEMVLFPPFPDRLVFPSAISGRRVLDGQDYRKALLSCDIHKICECRPE